MRAYERFLKYVAFPTMSDPESESVPSTKKQLALAEALAAELREMGLVGVEISEYGYVYASLPANYFQIVLEITERDMLNQHEATKLFE